MALQMLSYQNSKNIYHSRLLNEIYPNKLFQKKIIYFEKKQKELYILEWKIKYIEYILEGKIRLYNLTKIVDQISEQLQKLEFPKIVHDTEPTKPPSYSYIFEISFSDMTLDSLEKMKDQRIN